MNDLGVWIAVGGFILQFVGLIIAGTRGLAKAEASIRKEIVTHRKELDDQRDADLRTIGEGMQAIRQKITEVEIWGRDNYARRDGVHTAIERFEKQIAAHADEMKKQMMRFDDKLDRIQSRQV